MENNTYHPLLPQTRSDVPKITSFSADSYDTPPIAGIRHFLTLVTSESRKLWFLAGPAIFTSLSQFSLCVISQTFAGHVGTLELAAFSVEDALIAGFSLGIMRGMGSALETLCGQAYGAGQVEMLGVYMQRSWVILLATALLLMFVYIFALPILLLIGQKENISRAAGNLARWMIPQLFAYAVNFPISKFLQAQSKITVMALISVLALGLHTVFSWFVMLKLGWGLAGGAAVLNASWWFMVVAQLVYIFSGACGTAWSGFSFKAFQNLWGFVKLSLTSAVMQCLETWYYMAIVLLGGYLKDAEVSVDALAICTNIFGLASMMAAGFNAAVSVRVSNELGACHPRTAKFSVLVVVLTSSVVGLLISVALLIFKNQYPSLFSDSESVKAIVKSLTPLLAVSIIISTIQPALSGVVVGAGWQALVAYVNIGCYYLFGIPIALIMGYGLNMSVHGIWLGIMIIGITMQALVLVWIICRTNWDEEASIAGKRIKLWGGEP